MKHQIIKNKFFILVLCVPRIIEKLKKKKKKLKIKKKKKKTARNRITFINYG